MIENLSIALIFIILFYFVNKDIINNAENKINKPTKTVRYCVSTIIASLGAFVIYVCIFYS
jgi:hypothetical protein